MFYIFLEVATAYLVKERERERTLLFLFGKHKIS